MPVYEYECKNCNRRFEKLQPVMADPLTECINCGQGPLRRIFHPVGVIFKGSGWYSTDSRSSSSGSSGSDSSSTSATDGGTKSESKSEAKADSSSTSAPKADTSSE